MSFRSASTNQTLIYQIIFGLAIFALGYFALKGMVRHGSMKFGYRIMGAMVVFGIVLALDRRYWILFPLLNYSGFSFPRLPFSGPELGCILVIGTHLIRLGLHRDRVAILDRYTWAAFPVFLWIAIVFCLNPTGLAMLGSHTIGLRFYIDIVLGMAALFAFSAQRLNESDAKLLFWTIGAGMLFAFLRSRMYPAIDPDEANVIGETLEGGTRYALISFGYLYILLFCRYPLSYIVYSGKWFVLAAVFAALTVASGKRQMFARLFLVPWFTVFLRRRDAMMASAFTFLGAFLLAFLIAGDRHFYRLPRSATRSLAIVAPMKYQGQEGLNDRFRAGIRREARRIIRDHPFVGRRGFAMDFQDTIWLQSSKSATIYEGHANAGNWHSTWYAYAADFGLPCMVLFGYFFLTAIYGTCKGCRQIRPGTYLHACALWYAVSFLCQLTFSYTSGHSADSFFGVCTNLGMALAVIRGAKESGMGMAA